jgi:putative PIN family toxin of toxin-antitoxin system
MRVVLDTNVLVSRVVVPNGKPAQILQQCENGRFEFLTSEALLAECRRVLAYKRIRARHRLTDDELDEAISKFRTLARLIEVSINLQVISADPDDNKVFECAVEGNADYIVSGDTHLLDLGEYQGIQILPPAAFLMVLEQEQVDA